MFRKIIAILFILSLCFSLMISASAQTTAIHDDAGLLDTEEVRSLEEKAAQLKELYDVQAVILTVNSLNGFRAQDYADNYYDQAGYDDNGVLFLLAMSEREWYISTSGTVIYALTDYAIQKIGEGAVSYFAEELWYHGFAYFLDTLPAYLDALDNGAPIDGSVLRRRIHSLFPIFTTLWYCCFRYCCSDHASMHVYQTSSTLCQCIHKRRILAVNPSS